ncbi:hypothetical protein pEaSNUABM46_00272 [Erwinia phage pEa_SNUABM_46]|nr:hypothetical protein pEaSNUABM45_00272 [Erwinia phage pEa_SNUABM_45]QYW04256.1 hypothetical protein pEaSNUABM46_00272 [Erwinia phage pEa_SNUABM_46]
MNNESAMIDEDVLEWLEDLTRHKLLDVIGLINNLIFVHRPVLDLPTLGTDEDVAALSHADLTTLFRLVAPECSVDTNTLSNLQLLGLMLNQKGVVVFSLPNNNSPILTARTFNVPNKPQRLNPASSKGEIATAVSAWLFGLFPLELRSDQNDMPRENGLYLAKDEHEQIRFGRLFRNGAEGDGWTFCESYSDATATYWHHSDSPVDDELPMSLLHSWLQVSATTSPNEVHNENVSVLVTDSQRIFAFLRSLSQHVKAELVANFDGVLNSTHSSVESIGRLTRADWTAAAVAVADDKDMKDGLGSWEEHSAWDCFVATLQSLRFNFDTREFDPMYDYGKHDNETDIDRGDE